MLSAPCHTQINLVFMDAYQLRMYLYNPASTISYRLRHCEFSASTQAADQASEASWPWPARFGNTLKSVWSLIPWLPANSTYQKLHRSHDFTIIRYELHWHKSSFISREVQTKTSEQKTWRTKAGSKGVVAIESIAVSDATVTYFAGGVFLNYQLVTSGRFPRTVKVVSCCDHCLQYQVHIQTHCLIHCRCHTQLWMSWTKTPPCKAHSTFNHACSRKHNLKPGTTSRLQ